QLLVAAAAPATAPLVVRGALVWLGRLGPTSPWEASLDEIVVAAAGSLEGGWRSAAADRPAVRAVHPLEDPRAVSPPWPAGAPFPDPSTPAGIAARLNWLDYGAGAGEDGWTPALRSALSRWQIHAGLEPTGSPDPDTIERLTEATPDAP
ncbi:MAG: peptidoglycan-binding domain-containing protein, partial [Myxococcota bacterium]